MTAYLVRGVLADGTGRQIAPTIKVASFDVGADTMSELQNYTDASMIGLYVTESYVPPYGGLNGTPWSIHDCLDLSFISTGFKGTTHIIVPMPIDGLLLSDLETVNPAAISGLIDVIIANGVSASGNPLDTYVRGSRRTLPNQHR